MCGEGTRLWTCVLVVVLTGALLAAVATAGGRPADVVAAGEEHVPAGLTLAEWARIDSQLPIPVQEAKLTADDAQTNDLFGTTVAVAGDTVVVGAFGEASGAGDPLWNAGAAYLFERNQGGINNWGQVAKLTAGDPGFGDQFGQVVAIHGDIVAVGAPYENGGPGNPISDAGAVYIFARDQGGPANWGQVKKVTASDPGEEDDFGLKLSLSGDMLAVGAPGEDGGPGDPMSYAGAVYLFERNQGGADNWGEVAKLAASDAESGDGFGGSVALDGDTLVAGAPSEDGGVGNPIIWAGAVYVFERNEGGVNNWGEVVKLAASDAGMNDRFGSAAAIDGDTLVVAAPFEDGGPGDPLFVAGAAYVFERNQGGPNNWGEVTKLAAGDPDEGDFFGGDVAVRGDRIVAGSAFESGGPGDPLTRAGALYVFERDVGLAGNWSEVAKVTAEDVQPYDSFGSSVAANNAGVIFSGAIDGDAGGPPLVVDSGAAYVFCLDDNLEENDDFAQATAIAPGSFAGLQECGGDDDYFSLTLAAGDVLDVDIFFSHAAGNLDLALYDTAQNLLVVSDSQVDNEHLAYQALAAGQFFVRVYGYEGAHGEYDLQVTTAAGEVSFTLYVPVALGP